MACFVSQSARSGSPQDMIEAVRLQGIILKCHVNLTHSGCDPQEIILLQVILRGYCCAAVSIDLDVTGNHLESCGLLPTCLKNDKFAANQASTVLASIADAGRAGKTPAIVHPFCLLPPVVGRTRADLAGLFRGTIPSAGGCHQNPWFPDPSHSKLGFAPP